jgi:hypothetical protein
MPGKIPDQTLAIRGARNCRHPNHTSHSGFQAIQKIGTIHDNSGFIRVIPANCRSSDGGNSKIVSMFAPMANLRFFADWISPIEQSSGGQQWVG